MNHFDRNAWCFLGIPVDAISYQDAVEHISSSALNRQACFFSTPNLNFTITALKDPGFLNSVIASDLVLLDGMPPVWLAKLIGIPGIEKVSGSNLFETLWHTAPPGGQKIRVFLFGGEEEVAAKAGEKINRLATGIECVGSYYPGFDSIQAMSSDRIMQLINDSDADFIVVALGARKGQAWIMANRASLQAPVISHLGAVVNFAAETIARAPAWMQAVGAEWLWRIWQEPALWRRYLADGIDLLRLMIFKIVPYAIWRLINLRRLKSQIPVEYSMSEDEQSMTIFLKGDCLHGTIAPLRALFEQGSKKCRSITLDMSGVDLVDGAFLGLCLLLYKEALAGNFTLTFASISRAQRKVFSWNCAEHLL